MRALILVVLTVVMMIPTVGAKRVEGGEEAAVNRDICVEGGEGEQA